MPLNAAYADEIVQEGNSTYQLTFRFPTSDSLWEQLKEETFLTADDLHGEQDFVIFEVEKKHGYIQVYANQVFTLLNNYVVNPISLDRQTGSTALSRFAGSITRDNPFSFFSDIEDRHTFNIGSKNAMEAFAKDKHSIIGQWGGDLVRHGYQVRLLKNGGSENESLFMYKKNLSSYQHKTSTKSLKTRITFIATVKGEGEKAPDRTFTVTIDSPLINKYSQIYEDVIEVNDQDVKDEASLRKYGEQYYRTSLCDMMEDSLEIDVVGQSDVPVQMFDVVSLFHEVYNLDVRKKITKYTYSPMAKKLKSIGFGQFQSGLANAIGNAVSDAVKGEAQQLQDDFERQLARELKNADLTFDRQKEELVNQFTDGLNAAKARAEEVKRELSDTINQRFNSFDNGPLQEAKRRAEEALRNAGASSLLAQEAKRIGLDSVAKLEEFKRQATSAQTALSGDLDALKRTVASEVNQASEYRRTTTEVLSRMTGQMNGFATKSEVAQGIDGLTQTFAKMRVGGANLLKGSKGPFMPDRKPANFDNNILYVGNTSIYMEQGQEYIISAKTDGNFTAHHDGVKESDNVVLWIMDKNIRNYQIVSDLNTGTTGTKIIWNKPTGIYHLRVNTYHKEAVKSVWDVKIEKGNVATDWSPAFEDTDGLITEAKATFEQTAQGLRTDLSAIQEYVNRDGQRKEALQRYTREESAKQATAVRELVSRDFVGKASYQEDVRGLERRFEAITNPKNGLIATQIATYKNAVDGRFADITSQIAGKANQTDFQRVRETSQLYERILGNTNNSIADNIARMALTNQLFQVEVAKAAKGGRNYIRGIKEMRVASGSWDSGTFRGSGSGSIRTIDVLDSPVPGFNKAVRILSSDPKGQIGIAQDGFEIMPGTYTMSVWVKGSVGQRVRLQNYWAPDDATGISPEFILKDDKWTYLTFSSERKKAGKLSIGYVYLVNGAKGGYIDVLAPQLEEGSLATSARPAIEDTDEAIRSVQSQLAGSWAVQNINSAGDLISGLNLGANGHNRLSGKLTHITGETLIERAVIKSAMVDKLKTGNFEAGSVTTVVLDAEAVTAEKLKVDQAFFNKLVANEAYLSQLFAKQAFINRVQSVAIDASQIKTGVLTGGKILGGTITGSSISGGIITGSSISGSTLTGRTKIQLGTYGSFETVNGGLQINVPRTTNSKDGLGVQFIGSYGRGENVPYGLFIYKDPDITVGNTVSKSDDFLLTVEGYINAKGIGWLRTGKSSVNNKLTATLGLWNSSNVSLEFGGSGNDIYYSYNGTAYSLWSVVNQHFSDRRLKENIVDCNHKALDCIHRFQFKEYDWKKQEDRPQQAHTKIGLIAQEVQAVDPTLVYENGDTLNLDNLRLTNIALKAIQELALENRKLTQRLENLENERRTA
jgi:phage minor structural protein